MALQTVGQTTHFLIQYDDMLGTRALGVANAVRAGCEADLQRLSFAMPYQADGRGDPFRKPKILVHIVVAPPAGPSFGGGDNNGFSPERQSRIRINPFAAPDVAVTDVHAGFVFVAEMAKILMSFHGWDASSSQGEALARVMAEAIHPAATHDFVSMWLSMPRPRPDWIAQNAHTANDGFPRGDGNPVAYGCGIIFIYFLHEQLGFSFHEICTCGGELLSDRYRALTQATDDPALRVGDLLDRHFGTGAITGVPNNPFPLYDRHGPYITFSSASTAIGQLLPGAAHAHITPFFTCPAASYPYNVFGAIITQTITATVSGLGLPTFTWRINGKKLVSTQQSGATVASPVQVPDPQNPEQPLTQTQTLTFDYTITRNGSQSSLTLTSLSFGGEYQLALQVEADETIISSPPVTAQYTLILSTRRIVYGGTYLADRERCEAAFLHIIGKYMRRLQSSFNLLRDASNYSLPDSLGKMLKAGAYIRDELEHLAATDNELATQIAHYAATQIGVPIGVFLKAAENTSRSAMRVAPEADAATLHK